MGQELGQAQVRVVGQELGLGQARVLAQVLERELVLALVLERGLVREREPAQDQALVKE
jgi:hypothetical protein